jgi:hypothetical protein
VNDAGHGAEEAQERCDRGDGAQGIEKALELMHDVPAAILEPLDHERARFVAVYETDGEELPQGGVLLQGDDQFVAQLIGFDPVPDLLRQITRNDAARLQGP